MTRTHVRGDRTRMEEGSIGLKEGDRLEEKRACGRGNELLFMGKLKKDPRSSIRKKVAELVECFKEKQRHTEKGEWGKSIRK